jgi:hypothetical protein
MRSSEVELATVQDVAEALGVTPKIVERLADEERIPVLEVPCRVRMFDLQRVLKAVRSQREDRK